MIVHRHAAKALVALTQRMPVPASVVIARLESTEAPDGSLAIEVCRLKFAVGNSTSSNGDSVVVIVRDGTVVTAMLRRSWNQPFNPAALRVDEVTSWRWTWTRAEDTVQGEAAVSTLTRDDTCIRPPEGWSEPDERGYVKFTMYDRVDADAPHRDGFYPWWVAVHGSNFTTWTYIPADSDLPADVPWRQVGCLSAIVTIS